MTLNNSCSILKKTKNNRLKELLQQLYRFFQSSGPLQLILIASLIGIVGGLGSIAFKYLILFFKFLFYGATSTDGFLSVVLALPWWWRVLAPALGGLIIGPLIYFIVPEAKGHGVPEVMEAVAVKKGLIRFRVVPLKAVISAICIGSGGSAGREGPIVQIGSAFGSTLGNFLKLSPTRTKTLLAAGAAAGIAGTFNAPLAGVIFSIEVILRKIKPTDFATIVIASVIGTAVSNAFAGGIYSVFNVPPHRLISMWELLLYIGLGLAAAIVALIYENTLYAMEDIFEKIKLPPYLLPALGGLLLGLLILAVPGVQATGYPVMEEALHGNLPLQMVFFFMIAKILATIFSLGSGGSGGIFAPALFIGSMLGATYGHIVNNWLPNLTGGPGSYAMVGMGAVFAGATHAPLTAIIILFEMTHDHRIILPMMFACIISSFVTKLYQKKNIYTTKLLKRGLDIDTIEEQNLLENITVGDAMTKDPITIDENATIAEAREYFAKSFYSNLPVIRSETGELTGVLSHEQVFSAAENDQKQLVREVSMPPGATLYENDSLLEAIQDISQIAVKIIPVLASDDSNRLVGVLARGDILDNYSKQIFDSQEEITFNIKAETRISVSELVHNSLRPLKNQFQSKGVKLTTRIKSNLPEIGVDFTKMSWVITSLLGNALRYSEANDEVIFKVQQTDNMIVFQVIDNGSGMSKDCQKSIFGNDTDKPDPQKCQGLAIAREIIEGHGGKVWIESTPGEGTEVSFSLPLD